MAVRTRPATAIAGRPSSARTPPARTMAGRTIAGRTMAGMAWWLLPPVVLALLGGWLVSRRYGMWFDELYTAEVAPIRLARLVEALVRGEGTIDYLRDGPPSYNAPYYAITHLWLALTPFGPDEVGLRMLSLVASVGAAGVFTRAVARMTDRRTGLIAGLLLATNPFVVAYAGEARGYGLALLATALAALGFARWLDGAPRALLLFGVAAGAAGLAHWFALLVPVGFAVAALVLRRRRTPLAASQPRLVPGSIDTAQTMSGDPGPAVAPLVAVTAVAALPTLIIVAIALANGVGGAGAEWIRPAGWSVPRLLLRSWTGGHAALLVLTVLAVAAGMTRWRGRSEAGIVAVCWVGVPVALVTLAEIVRPVYVDRYLLPAAIGLAMLAALGVARLPTRWMPVALAALLVASAGATVSNLGQGPREDIRGAVAWVAERHQPGEPVVAAARWDALGVDHYTRRLHPELTPDLVLPPAAVPDAVAVWVVRRATAGVKGDTSKLADLDGALAATGLQVTKEHRFPGRRAVVLVQRWSR